MAERPVEREILERYIAGNRLKLTRQRKLILKTFLEIESHLSAEELYRRLQAKDKSIGLATVYRTLKLLAQAGLAAERRFGDGQTRYEHVYAHEHHDHLVCEKCGEIVEFSNPRIERLQAEISKELNFSVTSHRLELHGICSKCRRGDS